MHPLYILIKSGIDVLLFPFRCLVFFLQRKRLRKEIQTALTNAAAVGAAHAPSLQRNGNSQSPKTIFISVGDISAEPHAIRLMQEVNRLRPNTHWIGFGGKRMQEAGCEILFNPVDLALIGFSNPAKQIPAHWRALKQFSQLLKERRVDLVILIDYPGFNLALAQAAQGKARVLYYICPQLWAWAPWRLKTFRKCVDRAVSILPFEAEYFRKQGIPADFVGHPIADRVPFCDSSIPQDKAALAPPCPEESKNRRMAPVLTLLPGSREKEILLNLPAMLRIVAQLQKENPELQIVLPHEREKLIPLLRELLAHSPCPVEIRPGKLHETLAESRFVFVKSGTAVLEVAHFEVPMIVFYRFPSGFRGWLSDWARHNLLLTPFFTSLNLLAAKEIVPEFAYSQQIVEEKIFEQARLLWKDGEARERCLKDLQEVRERYDLPGAGERTAKIVLEELDVTLRK